MLENSHYKRVVAVAIALIFVGFSTIKAQDLLYESGPLYNETGEPNKSILQDMLGMTTLGFASLNSSGYRIADKFTLNTHSSIQKFDFFAYQTGESGMLSINGTYPDL